MDTSYKLPKWMVIVCCVMVACTIALFVATNTIAVDFNAKYTENNVKIGDLRDQIANLNVSMDTIDTEEVVSDRVESCAELGILVAECQTNYQYLSASSDYDNFMTNVYALDACFGDNDKEARVPWYQGLPEYDIEYVWEFQSTYEFTSTKVSVIWLCKDVNTNDLLSYTVGIYDAGLGVFTNVDTIETSIGYSYLYPNDSIDSDLYDTNGDGIIDENDSNSPDDSSSSGNIVDTSEEPDGIGSGGAHWESQRDDESDDSDNESFGDDFQDYDDYVGSES